VGTRKEHAHIPAAKVASLRSIASPAKSLPQVSGKTALAQEIHQLIGLPSASTPDYAPVCDRWKTL
jgi:hypothetical protein